MNNIDNIDQNNNDLFSALNTQRPREPKNMITSSLFVMESYLWALTFSSMILANNFLEADNEPMGGEI